MIDAAALEKDWGIRPDQVVDFLALTGDAVDNVPGVPGSAEGFAATLLKEFGTLDNLLANVDQVKGPKKQQSLREHAETARRARTAGGPARRPAARARLGRLEDQPARRQAHSRRSASSAASTGSSTSSAPAETRRRGGRAWEADYHVVDTPELFQAFLAELKRQPRFCIDTETTALDPLRAELVGLSF